MKKRIYLSLMAAIVAAVSFAQTLVTLPDGATVESYSLSDAQYMYTLEGEAKDYTLHHGYSKNVAVVGNDVYIQGLSIFMPTAWVKGTVSSNGRQVVVKSGQFLGNYPLGDGETAPFYLVGQAEDSQTETDTRDFVFDYDSTSGTLSLNSNYYILESLVPTVLNQYVGYWSKLTLTRGEPEYVVEVPEGLTAQDYLLQGTSISYNADGSVAGMTPVSYPVKVGFQGAEEVYVQGLSEDLPQAWVKGELNDGTLTFSQGQYLGKTFTSQYLCGMFVGELSDFVCSYDSATGTISSGSYYMVINSSKTQLAPYAVVAGVTLTKVSEKAATPADPAVTLYLPYTEEDGYGIIRFNIPPVDTDGEGLVAEKLSYQLYQDVDGTVSDYVFTRALYENLPEESMTEIPYTFSDGYDFYYGGSSVALYKNSLSFKRIGIQSIYRGAGEERRSNIVWYDLSQAAAVSTAVAEVVGETFTDLQGRPATAATRGLLIRQQRMADGTVRTRKVVRR